MAENALHQRAGGADVALRRQTAIDLDAMTWRGIGLSGAAMPVPVLTGFAAIFWTIAASRFRWEEG